ncbi:DUF4160 domain-containing protein [Clostridium butyricum]|nr:DUF4160 domain-containing protein [Clostridium butyricum]NFB89385.1 DUF4160 domain-containing protein [Clostridium butyricum]UTY54969.1 DUF4160 domain-containing protein [Clostridium butyricum]
MVDLLTNGRSTSGKYQEFLVKKLKSIKIKMYQEEKHALPHVHVDFGKQHHIASYSIENGERLVGNLDKKYDKVIESFICENRSKLLNIWDNTVRGIDMKYLVAEISSDTEE